jgi:hypothetical protein
MGEFLDGYTIKVAIAVGALVLLLLLWLVWKFFSKLFKYAVLGLLLGAAGAAYFYYRSLPPPPPDYVGKHAYGLITGRYLGVVEGQGEDKQRGPIWIVRLQGGYPTMYPKSRVALKDKWEPGAKTEDSPTPAPSPASTKDGARKKK